VLKQLHKIMLAHEATPSLFLFRELK